MPCHLLTSILTKLKNLETLILNEDLADMSSLKWYYCISTRNAVKEGQNNGGKWIQKNITCTFPNYKIE